MCPEHGQPIVAYEYDQPDIFYCEKCVYSGKAKRAEFMAVVAGQLAHRFEGEYNQFKSHCDELEEINNRQIRIEMQQKV